MAFTGTEDHDISLELASEWTANYRNTITSGDTIGHFFGKTAIQQILDQATEDCVGIRIYYALDNEGKKQLIVVGVKANEDDIYEGLLAERSFKSPPYNGTNNSLNS